MELVPVGDDATSASARDLVGEYLSWVAGMAAEHHRLVFDTEAMLASDIDDRRKFFAPNGRFYLVCDAQAFVGIGALQRVDAITAEVQRMYVQPPWRGRGAARLLLDRLLDDARAMGCSLVRLESLKSLAPAHALYRSAGFVEVPPHDDNRMRQYQDEAAWGAYRDSAVFMALRLRPNPV
jgi:GNAT superfamily N-acetyltransferase